jgi:hypothetical protein
MILDAGIKILDIEFPDGSNPPKHIIKYWLQIVSNHFGSPTEIKKKKKEVQES